MPDSMDRKVPAHSFTAGLAAFLVPTVLHAHTAGDGDHPMLFSDSPSVIVPLLLLVGLYVAGVARIWRRAGIGHGLSIARASAFLAGVLALVSALVWPLDALGTWSLSAHIGQHMMLMAFAAPLLVMGHPGPVIAHAVPRNWARAFGRTVAKCAPAMRNITLATLLHSVVLWIWHLPRLTAAAVENDALHWLMHGTFLASGILFWSAIASRHRDVTAGAGAALLALVALMMQMGLLGALLCFAPRPLYPVYVERAPVLDLDPLIDQQLAGLVMWVPTCLPYLVAAAAIVVTRLGPYSDRRMRDGRPAD
jgi:putative membrane protein